MSHLHLDESLKTLSDEELKQRIKTLERHVMVGEQDFYEKRAQYKKHPNETNLTFLLNTAETAIDRYARLREHYLEYISRLEKALKESKS
ncbi:hypothetical protein B9Q13_05800 [Candidatus Marsarchaeota G2 archaeon ECH_B_SAG-G16]|jgi:hypothetical protein|uniref:Uncharacterized protein n=4 Tax=Candidatus Marsarchaeota TaxID=1978152 RepID=A0A2R6AI73_9ARCH|nr:MAG: hypothetical protein B9Q01_03775 [Candidatus Marsarchaeota G1 archaeon OSP_D]PSN86039.1 MAG: hypothetical protein B9Q02_03820 [Candidatus Marsarchaeota G1 archaeon BE_D]PSN87656.1 MAG: hypothetical protein B9Q00_08185 [Candidatus Marsarchaeota G1 archaeon OSP_C]PSO04010.1 MAG: hypothetical protein B9Q13_05800 [Candidatus Marsarchaeota G2 archaeon ECH_B_SAG-G16]